MKLPDPPKELLEQRPGLVGDDSVRHEAMGVKLGSPPLKYTKAVHDRICEELKKGQRPQGACARAGITLATFHNWVKKGKEGDPWLYEFAQDVEIAINWAEAEALDVITDGFNKEKPTEIDPERAKWFLERARSDGFSKQVKQVVENQIQDFLLRLESALDAPTFERVLAVYLGQAPAAQIGTKEIRVLPEHGNEENGSE